MKKTEEILESVFEPSPQDCSTPREDLQLAVTLNPSLDRIEEAMEECAVDFVEWLLYSSNGLLFTSGLSMREKFELYNNRPW